MQHSRSEARPTLTHPGDPAAPSAPPTVHPPPGVRDAFARVRETARGLFDAHLELLRAELALAGRVLAVVAGLALAAFVLAALLGTLLFVGSFLFLGEWLFGSMGWGLLHGTLVTLALLTGIGLNLAGGWMGAYSRGLLVGLVTTVVLSLVFASNILRDGAVTLARELEDDIALHPNLLPTLVGLVVGALVVAGVALAAGLVMGSRSASPLPLAVGGLVVGAVLGAVLGSVRFDNPGAVAVALTLGLVAWIVSSVGLAAARGFDPEVRYAALIPRESIAAFEDTRAFLERQWERQKRRMTGR